MAGADAALQHLLNRTGEAEFGATCRTSSVDSAVAAAPTGSPERASRSPRASTIAMFCVRSPGTAAATRFRIAWMPSRSMRPAPAVVSITLACASCRSRANGSRRGSTRCTRHLVLPRREPFARDRQEAQASVILTTAGVGRLDREGMQAILNLVPRRCLACGRRTSPSSIRAATCWRAPANRSAPPRPHYPPRRCAATELRLARAVEEMLERSLGPGHVRAEAAVRMSFEPANQTEERYDPDGQVTRSSQNVTSNSKSTEANGSCHRTEQPAERRCRPRECRFTGGTAGETTNFRDRPARWVRLIREQPQIDRLQPGGHGRRHEGASVPMARVSGQPRDG